MKKKILFYIVFLLSFTVKSQNSEYIKFIGIPVDLIYTAQLNDPKIYDYSNMAQAKITQAILDNIPEKAIPENQTIFSEEGNYILLIFNFNFNYKGLRTYIIKYKTFEKNESSEIKVVAIHLQNDNWILLQDEYLRDIESVIKELSLNSFFEFYNNENNSNFPEINKLKPLVKDSNGILNIFKLAKIIEKNKVELSNYLDN